MYGKSFSEQLNDIIVNISRYKKDVIDQKYENDLAELKSLLADLRNISDRYFKENQQNFTFGVCEELGSNASEAFDYISLIASEMKRFILKDSNLNAEDAEVLLAQNNCIKNLSLNYEFQRMLGYYEKASLEVRKQYKNKSQMELEERFVYITDEEVGKHYILKEFAEDYKKMVEMKKNVSKILFHDLDKLQSLYNAAVEAKEAIDLGELSAGISNLKYYLLTEKQIKEKMVLELEAIRGLSKESGMKEKYHFIIDGKGFQVIIPIGKKPIFEKHLQILSELQSVLKERSLFINVRAPISVQDSLADIQIDYQLYGKMTFQQQVSYLQSIMLRVESSQSIHMVKVVNDKNENKEIPALYYSVYEECKKNLNQLSMTINENYLKSLSDEDKIRHYEKIIDKIKQSNKEPFVMVENVKISAEYYNLYMNALTALNSLTRSEGISQQSDPALVKDKTGYREYKINESYVQTLSDELKLSYYANLIEKIATTQQMGPAVVYESFGVKLNIPISFVPTVQECERRALELKEKLTYQIRESKVRARSPQMQYSYYGSLIEKMKYSNKDPKMVVEAFGEKFEIPLECQDSFEECVRRMETLMNKMTHKGKRRKVKKMKKPFTKRVQQFWNKKANQVKIALSFAVTVGIVALASTLGNPKNADSASLISQNISIEQSVNDTESIAQTIPINYNTTAETPEKMSLDNERINQLAFNANQSLASSFGAIIKLNNEKLATSYDNFSNALPIYQEFQNDFATIVKISIRMPDQNLVIKNFFDENAQQEVNYLIEQGGVIECVGIVASKAEQNYYQTGNITGYIQIDENTNLTSGGTTKLSQDVGAYVLNGRSR